MRIRAGTIVKILVVAVIAVIAAGVAIIKTIDLNQYRGLIAEKAEAATGRKLTLAGDIYLNLFTLSPSVAIDDVSFANAPWGSRPEMAKIKRLEAQVALLPLLSKRIEVKRFVLVSPDILLETDASGKGNWEFKPPAGAAPPPAEGEKPAAAAPSGLAAQFTINEVDIKDGTLTYRDGKTKKTTTVTLDNLSASAESSTSPLTFAVAGAYNNAPFSAKGTVGSLSQIQAPTKPFPIDVEAQAGGAQIKTTGTIAQPMAARGLDLKVSVEGKSLADLAAFAPGLPAIGPYSLAGHVGDKGADIIVDGLTAKLGKSDLAGEVTLVRAEKPTVRANLTSNLIDLAELQAAAQAGAPAPSSGEKAEAQPAPAKAGAGRLFSDAPLPVAGLKAANADLKLKAAKVVTQGPALSNVNVSLSLANGKLTVKPLQADVVGGRIDGETVFDASQAQPVLSLNATAKGLDLAELVSEMKIKQKVTGKADFEGTASGAGGSVHAIMAGLNGRTRLTIGEMRVDNTLMKIVMADLAKAVVGSGDASKINCVASRFDIAKGLATSKWLVMDTDTVTIRGSGTIDLGTEQLNMYLDPSPKAAAVVDLAVPVKITGPLTKPNVVPDAAALAKKLGSKVTGAAGAVGGLGGVAGGVLGKVLGGKEGGGETAAAPAGANPCLETTAATAPAPAKAQPTQPAPAPTQPAEKPSGPLEGIGKTLKGLFE